MQSDITIHCVVYKYDATPADFSPVQKAEDGSMVLSKKNAHLFIAKINWKNHVRFS